MLGALLLRAYPTISATISDTQFDEGKEPAREFVVLGILMFPVRKKKQKYKNASPFLPENTKLAPALGA